MVRRVNSTPRFFARLPSVFALVKVVPSLQGRIVRNVDDCLMARLPSGIGVGVFCKILAFLNASDVVPRLVGFGPTGRCGGEDH